MDGTMALVIGQVVLSVVPPVPMIALVQVLNIVPLQTFGVPIPGKPDAGQASGRKIAGAVYGSRSHWAGGFPQPLRRRFGRTVLGSPRINLPIMVHGMRALDVSGDRGFRATRKTSSTYV